MSNPLNTSELQGVLDQMDSLAIICQNASSPDEEAPLLREYRKLFLNMNDGDRPSGLRVSDSSRLEKLISQNACDSAVLQMIKLGTGYMLSRNPDGSHIASLVLPGQAKEVTSNGATLALAMLGAIAFATSQNSLDAAAD